MGKKKDEKKKKPLRRWEVKNMDKKKEYKTALGYTDYDIPMFGYRSSLFILLVIFGSIGITIYLSSIIGINYKIPVVIVGSIASGLSFAISQYFIERKIGLCSKFYILSTILTIISGVIIYMILYTNIF